MLYSFAIGEKCVSTFAISGGGCQIYTHMLQMWVLKENSNLMCTLEFWQALICTWVIVLYRKPEEPFIKLLNGDRSSI